MMILMLVLWAIWIVLLVISFIVHYGIEHDARNFSEVKFEDGLNGYDAAEKMLRDNYIYTVNVHESKGLLIDYYNPFNRTLNLSCNVYYGKGVESIALAIHECGHILQQNYGRVWMILRSVIVPIVNFLNKIVPWVLIVGLLLIVVYFIVLLVGGSLFGLSIGELGNGVFFILLVGISLYGLTMMLALLMLPIEKNASKYAMEWVKTHNIISPENEACIERVLSRVSKTYVLNVLTSMTDSFSKLWDGITWVWFWFT